MSKIAQNIERIRHEISQISASPVTLVCVSKMKTIADIEQAYVAGIEHFGENYLQEAVKKIDYFATNPAVVWHFIGHIQSKKAAEIARYFTWVQSLERLTVAEKLHRARLGRAPLNVLVQINISTEEQKSGIAPNELFDFCKQLEIFDRLCLRGIMCINEQSDEQNIKKNFATMKALFDELKERYKSVDTLSMGMSGDFRLALCHGSTMVRIGSNIFGART